MKTQEAPNIFTIPNFLSPMECQNFIEMAENIGFEEAKVQIDGAQTMMKSIRNNSRILHPNEELAATIFDKIKPFCIEKEFHEGDNTNYELHGLNELWRFYKYEEGQKFKKHRDGSFVRNQNERSEYTLMIYLNDNFAGGETGFETCVISPKTGTALVFKHEEKHQGFLVLKGLKYVLRTDVMYKKVVKCEY
jgi:prolyl 4-hydroxylase